VNDERIKKINLDVLADSKNIIKNECDINVGNTKRAGKTFKGGSNRRNYRKALRYA